MTSGGVRRKKAPRLPKRAQTASDVRWMNLFLRLAVGGGEILRWSVLGRDDPRPERAEGTNPEEADREC